MHTMLTVVVAAIAGIILLCLVLFVCLVILRPDGSTLRDAARIMPDAVRLLSRLSRDRGLSWPIRVRLVLLVGYLAVPIDLVPDFIPILGYADDAIVIGLVLRSVIRRAGPDIVRQHWPGTPEGLDTLSRLCRIPALRVASN